jgi:hypothetical protein
MAGKDMLSYSELSRSALECFSSAVKCFPTSIVRDAKAGMTMMMKMMMMNTAIIRTQMNMLVLYTHLYLSIYTYDYVFPTSIVRDAKAGMIIATIMMMIMMIKNIAIIRIQMNMYVLYTY